MVKVVLCPTSCEEVAGHPTGVWLEELAAAYYVFKEKGFEVSMASPKGGPVPIDAGSLKGGMLTDGAKKFLLDHEAMGMLSHTTKLDAVDVSGIDCLYMPGGHGTCGDYVQNAALKTAIETLLRSDKVVGTVCHGPNCLVDCTNEDGTPLVKGKKVTGFSDAEEEAAGLTKICPFLLEAKLKELGAEYSKHADMWKSHVVVDGKLVTGQNPGSSEECAIETAKLLA